MIWSNYVFRRGSEVEELWDQLAEERKVSGKPLSLLYIAGRGFDIRANSVLDRYVDHVKSTGTSISTAQLVLVGFDGYQLSVDLQAQTDENTRLITERFREIGSCHQVTVGGLAENADEDEDDIGTSNALRAAADKILQFVGAQTDVVLDISSLPRIAYLTLLLALLARVVPEAGRAGGLRAGGVTLQVLVGEDAALDSQISSEDPSNELVLIPGYAEAMQSEALRDTSLVWFPVLGENRVAQAQKVEASIPTWAEICPVLPHPSRNPRRGDALLVEYDNALFSRREIPLSNVMYVHESHPFEAYRQLLGAMLRYRSTFNVLSGCRIVVTPLASKLITVGCALACFEMKLLSSDYRSSVAIPYAEPKRYAVDIRMLKESKPEITSLILTGDAYAD